MVGVPDRRSEDRDDRRTRARPPRIRTVAGGAGCRSKQQHDWRSWAAIRTATRTAAGARFDATPVGFGLGASFGVMSWTVEEMRPLVERFDECGPPLLGEPSAADVHHHP